MQFSPVCCHLLHSASPSPLTSATVTFDLCIFAQRTGWTGNIQHCLISICSFSLTIAVSICYCPSQISELSNISKRFIGYLFRTIKSARPSPPRPAQVFILSHVHSLHMLSDLESVLILPSYLPLHRKSVFFAPVLLPVPV